MTLCPMCFNIMKPTRREFAEGVGDPYSLTYRLWPAMNDFSSIIFLHILLFAELTNAYRKNLERADIAQSFPLPYL